MATTNQISRRVVLFLGLVVSTPGLAQFSATGATGVIATPSADVEAPGRLGLGYSNLLPNGLAGGEAGGSTTGQAKGKSLSLGLGLFPGLEIFGSFKELDAPAGGTRGSAGTSAGTTGLADSAAGSSSVGSLGSLGSVGRLVGLKYQLPFKNLPYNTRLALGLTDLSNTSSPYHHSYGVASSGLGPVVLSLGWSRSNHDKAMNGAFGSAMVRLSDSIHALADHDGETLRSGLRLVLPSLKALPDLQASVVATGDHYLLNLRYDLDGRSMRLATAPASAIKPIDELAASRRHEGSGNLPGDPKGADQADPADSKQQGLKGLPQASSERKSVADSNSDIFEKFRSQGFTQIRLGLDQDSKLLVTAEPIAWRKNRLDALGAALAAWYSAKGMDRTPVVLELTHLGMPVLRAETSGFCIAVFYEGRSQCEQRDAVMLSLPQERAQTPTSGHAKGYAQDRGQDRDLDHSKSQPHAFTTPRRPQFEIGPVVDLAAGTDRGILEQSSGLAFGMELPLHRGLMLQGQWIQELSKSDDFNGSGSVFRQAGRGVDSGLDKLLVNFQQPFLKNTLWTELALGQHGHKLTGLLATASWAQPHGLLRFTAQLGEYKRREALGLNNSAGVDTTTEITEPLKPALLTARVAVVPGRWALAATAGQFLNNDKGWRFESRHQFGDNTLSLYLHDTEAGNRWAPRPVQMVGVAFSFALGSSRSWQLGGSGTTLRASDRFTLGFEQEINEAPAAQELRSQGHGRLPPAFHGLLTDTLDHDRADLGAMRANLYRTRAVLRALLAN